MATRDRLLALGLLGAALVVWALVALVVTTRDPIAEPTAGVVGAALIGLAIALTLIPVLWLITYARQRGMTYLGDWTRAIRRGAWVGGIVVVFIVALAVVAEATLSAER